MYIYYVKAIENSESSENQLNESLEKLKTINDEGKNLLGDKFYPLIADNLTGGTAKQDKIETFIEEVTASYQTEKKAIKETDKNLTDYIICGGAILDHDWCDLLAQEPGIADLIQTHTVGPSAGMLGHHDHKPVRPVDAAFDLLLPVGGIPDAAHIHPDLEAALFQICLQTERKFIVFIMSIAEKNVHILPLTYSTL